MKLFEAFFLEYFVEHSRPYYMTNDGVLHNVSSDHITQIMDDYDLYNNVEAYWHENFDEDPDYDKDWDDICDYIKDYVIHSQIIFIVFDIMNKIVYVRGSEKTTNKKQKLSLKALCMSKNSELIYDSHAVA